MFKIVTTQGTGYNAALELLLAPLGGAWFLDSVCCAMVIASRYSMYQEQITFWSRQGRGLIRTAEPPTYPSGTKIKNFISLGSCCTQQREISSKHEPGPLGMPNSYKHKDDDGQDLI